MKINAKIYTRSLLISMAISGFVLQISLQSKIPALSKYDEVWSICAYLYLIYLIFRGRLSVYTQRALIIMGITAIIGLIGNFYWEVQTNFKAILTDLGIMYKVYASFFAAYEFFRHNGNNMRIQKYLNVFAKTFVLIGFGFAIINLAVDINMHTEYIYGLRAFHFVLNRVGNLNAVAVGALIVLTGQLNILDKQEQRYQKIFILMNIFLLISTLRTRAFAFVLVYVIGYVIFVKRKSVKIRWKYVLPLIIIVLYVAYPKIRYYFLESSDTARSVLFRYGFKTANDYFPLGAGFGSYGTFAAKENWSILYNRYNFRQYYGMSKDNGSFLTDNYWPAIAGEFGYIGLCLFVLLLIIVIRTVFVETKDRNIIRFTVLFGIVSLVIASTVSSSFFNYTNILNATLMAFELSNYSYRQMRDKMKINSIVGDRDENIDS